jgi:hypothetical protein
VNSPNVQVKTLVHIGVVPVGEATILPTGAVFIELEPTSQTRNVVSMLLDNPSLKLTVGLAQERR